MKVKFNQFEITTKFLGDKCWNMTKDSKMENWNNHKVTVKNTNTNKQFTFDFWQSIMHPQFEKESDVIFAFQCVVGDAVSSTDGFEWFCSEFGYDEDSRTAERIFKACEKHYVKLEKICESDCDIENLYQLLLDYENEYLKAI